MKLIIILATFFTIQGAMADDTQPVTAGTSSVKFNGLLQTWYVNDPTAASSATDQSFFLRRAELKLSGSVVEKTRWFVMIDAAKTTSATGDNKILQDFGVGITLCENLEFVMGQFKAPSLAESMDTSSGDLLLAERSRVSRFYAERRDPGAALYYKKDFWKLSAMASNGLNNSGSAAPNQTDTNRSKDFHARADFDFMDKAFKLGAFHSGGVYDGLAATAKFKSHNGFDVRYKTDNLNANLAYVLGKDDTTDTSGMVAELAYKFTDALQVAARHDSLIVKPLAGTEINSTATGFSLNYLIQGNNAKVQLTHFLLNNSTGGYGSYTNSATVRDANSVTILALQASI